MADRVDIKERVKRLLSEIGYMADTSDSWYIDFCIDKTENSIKSNCNIDIIPDILTEFEVHMAAGEFLLFKKNSGQLNPENINIDFDVITKSIAEGDTKVEFYTDGTLTSEQKFDKLTDYLLNSRKDDLNAYRCIKW